jgi:hypothetical protein
MALSKIDALSKKNARLGRLSKKTLAMVAHQAYK